jgi:outer membrane lipoprotein-sorting protein
MVDLKQRIAFAFLGAGLLAGSLAQAADPVDAEARGRQIAEAASDRGAGYGDVQARLTMVLRTRAGDEAVRELRTRTLEGDDGNDRSLIIFDAPGDVAGTALLTHAHADRDDDRWLYLPAVRRVKRIASSGQSGAFMGSEFSYEDLGPQDVDRYTFTWLRDEPLDGVPMHVLKRVPRDENSGYSEQHVWMDIAELRLHKVTFYDRRGRLIKTLTVDGFTQHDDRHWRPLSLEMHNHQNGRTTVLTFEDYAFDVGLSPRDFDDTRLDQVR